MKNLIKIMSIATVMLMCMSLLPVRSLAATNDPPYTPTNPKPGNNSQNTDDSDYEEFDQWDDGNPIGNGNIYKVVEENKKDKEEDEKDKKDKETEDKKDEKSEEDKKDEKDENSEEKEVPKRVPAKVTIKIGRKDLIKKLNGKESIIKMDAAPYIKNGRTMLPIRFVAEALGMSVTWDAKTRTVIIKDDEYTVEIPVDTKQIIVNGKVFESDMMPEIKDGRTMLPIANIARALGLKDGEDIFWDAVEKIVTIIRETIGK